MTAPPDRLDCVRVAPVLAIRQRSTRRAELEIAALVPVQQPAEDPGAVESGQAHPVDRAPLADQRSGPQVADHAVVADGRIPKGLLAHGGSESAGGGPKKRPAGAK